MSVDTSTLELAVKAVCTFSTMFLVSGSLLSHALLDDTDVSYRAWLYDTVALVELWPQEER